jgi:hypothetical protein
MVPFMNDYSIQSRRFHVPRSRSVSQERRKLRRNLLKNIRGRCDREMDKVRFREIHNLLLELGKGDQTVHTISAVIQSGSRCGGAETTIGFCI